jgi:hypothetical protein
MSNNIRKSIDYLYDIGWMDFIDTLNQTDVEDILITKFPDLTEEELLKINEKIFD